MIVNNPFIGRFNPFHEAIVRIAGGVVRLLRIPQSDSTGKINLGLWKDARDDDLLDQDHEGIYRTIPGALNADVPGGVVPYRGARIVQNLLDASEDFEDSVWIEDLTANREGVVLGVGPNGESAIELSFGSDPEAGLRQQVLMPAGTTLSLFSIWVRTVTGSSSLRITSANLNSADIEISETWTRLSHNRVADVGGVQKAFIIKNNTGGTSSNIYLLQAMVEDATGKANQNPSEYQKVDTANGFYGFGYYATENGNTVTDNVVSESTGKALRKSYMINSGKILDRMYLSSWTAAGTGSITKELTLVKTGTESIRLTCDAGENAQLDKDVTLDLSSTQGFWLSWYCPNSLLTTSYGITIYLSHEVSLGSGSGRWVHTASNSRDGAHYGWNFMWFDKDDFAVLDGTPDFANPILSMRIRFDNGSGTKYIVVDGLYFETLAKPKVLFTFDDGFESVYTEVYPYLKTKNISPTFYVIPDLLDSLGYITTAQLDAMYADGVDVQMHHQTNFSTLDDDQIKPILQETKIALSKYGVKHLAWPNGEYGNTNENWDVFENACLELGILTARTTVGSLRQARLGNLEPHRMNGAIALNSSITLAEAKAKVDKCIAVGATLIFYGHKIGAVADGLTWTDLDFQALVDYVAAARDAGSVDCHTVNEWYSKAGDIAHWPASTNVFLNSASPATQTISLSTTGAWTISCIGSGSAQIAANTATGTGWGTATAGADVTIDITAIGTVDVTIVDTHDYVQLENLSFSTPPIVTEGVAVSRDAVDINHPFNGSFNQSAGVLRVKFTPGFAQSSVAGQQGVFAVRNNALSTLFLQSTEINSIDSGLNTASVASSFPDDTEIEIAVRWSAALNEMQVGFNNGSWTWGTAVPYSGTFIEDASIHLFKSLIAGGATISVCDVYNTDMTTTKIEALP